MGGRNKPTISTTTISTPITRKRKHEQELEDEEQLDNDVNMSDYDNDDGNDDDDDYEENHSTSSRSRSSSKVAVKTTTPTTPTTPSRPSRSTRTTIKKPIFDEDEDDYYDDDDDDEYEDDEEEEEEKPKRSQTTRSSTPSSSSSRSRTTTTTTTTTTSNSTPKKNTNNNKQQPQINSKTTTTTTTTKASTNKASTTTNNNNNNNKAKSTPKQPPTKSRGSKKKGKDEEGINIHEERINQREVCNKILMNPEPYLEILKNILHEYQNKNVVSFSEFKDTWAANYGPIKNFHEAQPLNPEVIHLFYYSILGYTLLNLPINCKVSIIYSLYILYNSQIISPKLPIIITINIWETLLGYYNDFKNNQVHEGYYAFRELRKSGAFMFSATLHPVSTMNIFKTNSIKPKSSIIPSELVGKDATRSIKNDLAGFYSIHEEYTRYKIDEDGNIPSSLNVANSSFKDEIHTIQIHDDDVKFQKMLQTKTPGFP